MKKLLSILILILFFGTDGISRYNPKHDKVITEEDLVNFVKEAVAFVKIYGKKCALDEFKDTEGLFNRGELYIYAYNMDGVVLSIGLNQSLIGKDMSMLKDPKGELIIQEMLKKVKSDGKGWLKYYWFHPVTKRITPKYGYFEKVDTNWWLGSGIYTDSAE
jgi:cytochrome c